MPRRPPHLRHATLALAVVACQRPAQPERAAPAPLPAPPVALPDVAKKLDLPENAPTPEPARPEPARPEPISGPFAATAIEGGALVVSTQYDLDDDKTDISIKILDERGSEAGAPRPIRRTTGEIVDIAIHHHDGSAWIAWQSRISDDPRALVAAIRVAADLSSVTAPVTLNQYSYLEDGSNGPKVRVLARPGGAAIVAASGGNFNDCTDIVSGERTRCSGFDLLQIGPDGVSSRAAHFGADGGDPGLGALVDVGSGALVDVWAWHGGPTVATIYAPHGQPATDPPFQFLKDCRPPFERGFTGTELVTLCPGDYAAEGERCFVDGDPVDDGTCDRVHIVRLEDGRPITPARGAPLILKRVRCHDGRPVLEVGWKGGQRRLDPHAPGASLDLGRDLGIWTGSHALFLTDDGAVARHTCTRDGRLVPAEPAPG